MTLTVLTDDQIRSLLENLTLPELAGFQDALASALHEYSTTRQDETTSVHQPERISVHSAATGATTLFMPSCNSTGNGIKVITLTSPTATTATTTTTPSPASPPPIRPTGTLTLLTPQGTPLGFLSASTLTAFRTALASLALVQRRRVPSQGQGALALVVFGCGEQAYWHARLALLTRGAAVKRVVFVNRRASDSLSGVVQRFVTGVEEVVKEREGWAGCVFEGLVRGEEEEKVEGALREADVVVCCTPSTEELFDAGVWEGGEEEKGRLVVAIGSYTPEMREVPQGLVRRAVEGRGEREAGVVVVDTIEGALTEAGELIEAGVREEQMVELGELLGKEASAKKDKLEHWLQTGNVIYKSVGLGLMDLSIGMHVVEFAKEKGVGTHVQGF